MLRGLLIGAGLMGICGALLLGQRVTRYAQPVAGLIISSELVELSGIVPASGSRQFWGHNDSGHPPALFRFDDTGVILQRVDFRDARNVDWEGMTVDERGGLYIGDLGDNGHSRGAYTLYHLTEPEVLARTLTPLKTWRFKYPDGRSRDCEALFAMGDKLYVVSKEKSPDAPPTLFCIEGCAPGGGGPAGGTRPGNRRELLVREVGRLDLQGVATDAAWSPELKQLAVLTYTGVSFYAVQSESDLLRPASDIIAGFFGQAEALCYDGSDIILTNEPGMIWRIPAPSVRREPDSKSAPPGE